MSLKEKASIVLPRGAASKAGSIAAWNPQTKQIVSLGTTQATANLTRINEDGLIESVGANILPRDFLNGGCGEFNIWPQRTNINSDNTTPTNWYNSVLTPTNEGAFDLNSSADWGKYTQSGTVNNFGINLMLTNTVEYSISTYFDTSNSGDYLALRVLGSGIAVLQISTGSLVSGASVVVSAKVIDTSISNIKRVVFQVIGNGNNVFFQLPSSTGATGVNDGNTATITAFQVEAGKYETAVIFTTGSTETRDAIVLSQTGLSSLLGNNGGIYAELKYFDNTLGNYIGLEGATTDDRVLVYLSSGNMNFLVRKDANTSASISGSPVSNNTYYKVAARYNTDDFALYLNGVSDGTDSNGATFDPGDLVKLFTGPNSTLYFYGGIRSLAVFNYVPDNTQLAAITTP